MLSCPMLEDFRGSVRAGGGSETAGRSATCVSCPAGKHAEAE